MDIIDTGRGILLDGIGRGGPDDQIVSGFILGAFIIATSAVGLVGTLLLLPIPVLMIVLGVLRLWSPIDEGYPL